MMPKVGDKTTPQKLEGEPVERDVYIFKAVKLDNVIKGGSSFYKLVNGKLAGRCSTDKTGRFKIKLPPGKYSVFTMEEDGYFANIYDGENYINPVTVHPDSFTEIVILVNYKAYY